MDKEEIKLILESLGYTDVYVNDRCEVYVQHPGQQERYFLGNPLNDPGNWFWILWNGAMEKDWWIDFIGFDYEKKTRSTPWLAPIGYIHPQRFHEKLAEFLKSPGKHACQAVQHSDQMVCSVCDQAWDVNDPHPPECQCKD